MILALIVGFVTGWLISMPIGPVNATAIAKTLQHGFKYGLFVGLGAAVMDFIYCVGAAQIHEFLARSPIVNLVFQSTGFVLLIWLGVKLLRSEQKGKAAVSASEIHHKEEVAEHRLQQLHVKESSIVGSLMIGIVLYASNVAAVPEWIFISGFWRERGILGEGFAFNALFASGAGLGTAGWFITLVRFFSKRRSGFKPRTIRTINLVSAYAMLAFGVYFGYQILFGTDWQSVNTHVRKRIGDTIGEIRDVTNSRSPRAADRPRVCLPLA